MNNELALAHAVFSFVGLGLALPIALTQRASTRYALVVLVALGLQVAACGCGLVLLVNAVNGASIATVFVDALALCVNTVVLVVWDAPTLDLPWMDLAPMRSFLQNVSSALFAHRDALGTALTGTAAIVSSAAALNALSLVTTVCVSAKESDGCWIVLGIGAGCLALGAWTLLHLVNVCQATCLEAAEAAGFLAAGLLSLPLWDSRVHGLRVLDLSLLWLAGGLLSFVLCFQPWIVILQQRNGITCLILGWMGYSFLTMENEAVLGHMLLLASMSKFLHVVFRKANMSTRVSSHSLTTSQHTYDDYSDHLPDTPLEDVITPDDRFTMHDLEVGQTQQRQQDLAYTYQQLTKQTKTTIQSANGHHHHKNSNYTSSSTTSHDDNQPCKHHAMYASLAGVGGIMFCCMIVGVGCMILVPAVFAQKDQMDADMTLAAVTASFFFMVYLLGIAWLHHHHGNHAMATHANGYEYLDSATGDQCASPMALDAPLQLLNQQASLANDPNSSNNNTIVRPSQYRAKRRSLLTAKHQSSSPLQASQVPQPCLEDATVSPRPASASSSSSLQRAMRKTGSSSSSTTRSMYPHDAELTATEQQQQQQQQQDASSARASSWKRRRHAGVTDDEDMSSLSSCDDPHFHQPPPPSAVHPHPSTSAQ
ncbi:hypothetical protein BC940DRAFT_368174 [Gongronella butleri]|nr:hypothetical protein BC940DRAFT_368174 [Gongronella butleri]